MGNSKTLIHTVPFSELNIWDVKTFFHQADVFNKKHPVVLFEDFLKKTQIEKIHIEDENEYTILGARAYGKGVFINRVVKGRTLKMRVYQQAKKDHLFWCKVDTKNGAFGIVTKELAVGVGSSNMTFAKIDISKANPEYVQLLFKSRKVNEYMDGYVTGTTNRKYIKPNQLREEIKIPLPTLQDQNKIINDYKSQIQLAERQENQSNLLEEEIENYIYKTLEIKKIRKEKKERFRTINFKEVERWSVDTLGKISKIDSKFRGKYDLISLRKLISSYQYGLSEKSSKDVIGPPMLRMNNIDNSELDVSNLKYISVDEKTLEKYKLNNGDLLFNRTNSKELVGKTAIYNIDNQDFTFASYLIRVVINPDLADNRYINFLFNSSILQYQKDLVSRQITGQANINAQELQDLLFPYPSMSIQKEIADHISDLKYRIRDLKIQAAQNRDMAIKKFEQEIFS